MSELVAVEGLKNNHVREVHKVCRLCMSTSSLASIFDHRFDTEGNMREIVEVTTGVKVSPEDKISHMLCYKCSLLTIRMYKFRNNSMINDIELKEKVYKEDTIHKSIQNLLKQDPKLKIPPSLYTCNISPVIVIDKRVTDNFKIGKRRLKRKNTEEKASKKFKAAERQISTIKIQQKQHEEPLLIIKSVNKSYICDECMAVSYTRKEYKTHRTLHMCCILCHSSFVSIEETKAHKTFCSIQKILDSQPKVKIQRCDQIKEIRQKYSYAFGEVPIMLHEPTCETKKEPNENEYLEKLRDIQGSNTYVKCEPGNLEIVSTYSILETTLKLEDCEDESLAEELERGCSIEKVKEADINNPKNVFEPTPNINTTELRIAETVRRKSIDELKLKSNLSCEDKDNINFEPEKSAPQYADLVITCVESCNLQLESNVEKSKEIRDFGTSEPGKSNQSSNPRKSTDTLNNTESTLCGNVRRKSKSEHLKPRSDISADNEKGDEEFYSEKTGPINIETVVESSHVKGFKEPSGEDTECDVEKSENIKEKEKTGPLISAMSVNCVESSYPEQKSHAEKTEEIRRPENSDPVQSNGKTDPKKPQGENFDKKSMEASTDSVTRHKKPFVRKISLGRKSKRKNLLVVIPLEKIHLKNHPKNTEKKSANSSQLSKSDNKRESILAECNMPDNPKILYVDQPPKSGIHHTAKSNKENFIEIEKPEMSTGRSQSNESKPNVANFEKIKIFAEKFYDQNCKVTTATENGAISLLHNPNIVLDLQKQGTKDSETCDEPACPSKKQSSTSCEEVSSTTNPTENIEEPEVPVNSKDIKKLRKRKQLLIPKGPQKLKVRVTTEIYFKQKSKNKILSKDSSFKPNIHFVEENIIRVEETDDENAHFENLLKQIKKSKVQSKQAVQTCLPSNADILSRKSNTILYELKHLRGYLTFSRIPVTVSYAGTPSIKYTYEPSALKRSQDKLKNSTSKNLIVSSGNKNDIMVFWKQKKRKGNEVSKSEPIIKKVRGDSMDEPEKSHSIDCSIRIESVPAEDIKSSNNLSEMGKPNISETAIPSVSYAMNNMALNSTISTQTQFYLVKNSNRRGHVTVPTTAVASASELSSTSQLLCSANVLSHENDNMSSNVSSADLSYTVNLSSTSVLPNTSQVFCNIEFLSQRNDNTPITVSLANLPNTSEIPSAPVLPPGTTLTVCNTNVPPQEKNIAPANLPLENLLHIPEISTPVLLSTSQAFNTVNLPQTNVVTQLNVSLAHFPYKQNKSSTPVLPSRTQAFSNTQVSQGNINTPEKVSSSNILYIPEISPAPVVPSTTQVFSNTEVLPQGNVDNDLNVSLPKLPHIPNLSPTSVLSSTNQVFSNTKVLPRGNVDSTVNVPSTKLPHLPKLSSTPVPSKTSWAFHNTTIGNHELNESLANKISTPGVPPNPVRSGTSQAFRKKNVSSHRNGQKESNKPLANFLYPQRVSSSAEQSSTTQAFRKSIAMCHRTDNNESNAPLANSSCASRESSNPVRSSTTQAFRKSIAMSHRTDNNESNVPLANSSCASRESSNPVLSSTTQAFLKSIAMSHRTDNNESNAPLANSSCASRESSNPVRSSTTQAFRKSIAMSHRTDNNESNAPLANSSCASRESSNPVRSSTTQAFCGSKISQYTKYNTQSNVYLENIHHAPKVSTAVCSSTTQSVSVSKVLPPINGKTSLIVNPTNLPGAEVLTVPRGNVQLLNSNNMVTNNPSVSASSPHLNLAPGPPPMRRLLPSSRLGFEDSQQTKDNTQSNVSLENFHRAPKVSPNVRSSTTQSISASKVLPPRNGKTPLDVHSANPLGRGVPAIPRNNVKLLSSNNVLTNNHSVSESSPKLNLAPGPPPIKRLPPPMRLVQFKSPSQPAVRIPPSTAPKTQTRLPNGPSVPQCSRSHEKSFTTTVTQSIPSNKLFVVPQTPASNQMNLALPKNIQDSTNICDKLTYNNNRIDGTTIQNDLYKQAVSAMPAHKYIRVKNLSELM